MPRPSPLRISFARLCRDTRVMLDVTQAELAAAVGVSRSHLAEIEAERADASLDLAWAIADRLGIDLQLAGQTPIVHERRNGGLVHARCSGYVDRRFHRAAWLTARELETVAGRAHGWIDLMAFEPRTRTLVIVEVKTRLDDIGAMERQVSWYERDAHRLARQLGWRPRSATTWLLLLASEEANGRSRCIGSCSAERSPTERGPCAGSSIREARRPPNGAWHWSTRPVGGSSG